MQIAGFPELGRVLLGKRLALGRAQRGNISPQTLSHNQDTERNTVHKVFSSSGYRNHLYNDSVLL